VGGLSSPQLPWYVARACGIVAWALACASLVWGLALSTRALGRRPKAPWLTDLHRFLGGMTVIFVGLHLAGLAFDTYVRFGWRQLLVPFASHWKPGPVAWGIAAFYLLLAIEVTSLLMKRIPRRLWHGVHLTSYVMAVAATVHMLSAGTDRHVAALRWSAAAVGSVVLFFFLYRAIGPGRVASIRAGRHASPARSVRGASERASATDRKVTATRPPPPGARPISSVPESRSAVRRTMSSPNPVDPAPL
jgi:DMSO/TMAO reductase YedYZ heme-binding membrane subunit